MSERRRRGGSSKRARVKRKRGRFFLAAANHFSCVVALEERLVEKERKKRRAERESPHVSQREGEKEPGLRGTWSHSLFGLRRLRRESERGGRRGRPCLQSEAKRSWEGCLGVCPLDIVPRLAALPCWLACLPACLLGPGSNPPAPPFFSVCPLMPPFTLTLLPARGCLLSLYQLSPGAVEDLRMRGR